MVRKHNEYVIYQSLEGEGNDICIKDSLNRFVLVDVTDLDALILDLVKIGLGTRGDYSVNTPFEEIF